MGTGPVLMAPQIFLARLLFALNSLVKGKLLGKCWIEFVQLERFLPPSFLLTLHRAAYHCVVVHINPDHQDPGHIWFTHLFIPLRPCFTDERLSLSFIPGLSAVRDSAEYKTVNIVKHFKSANIFLY